MTSGGFGVFLFISLALFSIGLHELGHFATARWFGIKVEKFFIGFGPKLWSTRRGETEYGVSALPLGGYVKIAGMNPYEEVPEEDRDRVFKAKKPWQRAIVLAAGSTTHFILAFLIMALVFALAPGPDFSSPTREVFDVSPGTPAASAGMKAGDVIVAIDGERVETWQEVIDAIKVRPGETVSIAVERGGSTVALSTTLASEHPDGAKQGFLGVSPNYEDAQYSAIGAVGAGARWVGETAKNSLTAFKTIFSPSTFKRLFQVASGDRERSLEDPTTIIGIGRGAGDLARTGNYAALFALIAGFNVFVGVANLLPLPPLDGGHLAVLAYEKVRRRDVDMRKLLPLTAAVISVFATLFIVLLYLDIVRPLPPLPG